MTSTASNAFQLVLLFAWLLLVWARTRIGFLRRAYPYLLALLALVALAAHTDFLRYHERGEWAHRFDFYVYFTATKYFPELGYTGLYEATTVADYQDVPALYDPSSPVRSLVDYSFEPKRQVMLREQEIAGRFSPERWAEFKADLPVFRDRSPKQWSYGLVLGDHGYNGTPVTTALYGAIANLAAVDTPTFVAWMARADLLMVGAAALLIAAALGAEVGLLFLFFFGANSLNDFVYVGGSYLRYLHFVTLALAIVAFMRGKQATSGALFALAVHLRVHPLLFVLALAASHLLRSRPLQRLHAHRAFYGSFALASLLLLALTLPMESINGGAIWRDFAKKIELHRENISVNHISLRQITRYSEKSLRRTTWAAYERRVRRVTERRRPFYYGAAALLVGLSLWHLRRLRREEEAFFAGVVWLFVLLDPSHYELMLLALVPLFFRARAGPVVITAVTFALVNLARFAPVDAKDFADMERYFGLMSVAVGLGLLAVLVEGIRSSRAGSPQSSGMHPNS